MNEILRKKNTRNRFLLGMAIFIICILLIRYLALPHYFSQVISDWGNFWATILNGIVTSSTVTVLIGLFIFWVQPSSLNDAKIELEDQRELTTLFNSAFSKTDIWYYKGGCGRYFRTKTLPELAKYARDKSQTKEILVVILDPTNIEACKKHAVYRSGNASQKMEKEKWTLNKVRAELFSTIVTTLITQLREPRLRISLSLCPHYSSFRIDLSDDYAVITKEERNAPAIICHKGTYFYKSYKDEVVLSLNQSNLLKKVDHIDCDLNTVNTAAVQDILNQVGIYDGNMDDEFYSNVALICREKDNPYE